MKSLLCASIIIASAIPAIAFGFRFRTDRCNDSCNNAGTIGSKKYITIIDTMSTWDGKSVVQLYKIKGHEYIVVEAGAASGGTHIIHAESCPCKQK